MWAPALASLILAKKVERTSWSTRVGLRFRGRWMRLLLWLPLALVLIIAILLLRDLIAAARGVPMDLTGRTWLAAGQAQLEQIAMFLLPCIAMTLLLGALTDRAARNPLPAALGHDGVNTLSGVLLSVAATTQTMAHYSHFLDGPLGIVGGVLMAAVGLLLLIGRRDPALPQLDPLAGLFSDQRENRSISAPARNLTES